MLRRGLAAEGCDPGFRRQLADESLRVRGDTEQDILEVVERREVDELAALDERVKKRSAPGALEAAREEPVLPSMETFP